MKFGLWLLPIGMIGAVGTILAASLPVPPPLPGNWAAVAPAGPAPAAAAMPGPATPVVAAMRRASIGSRGAAVRPRGIAARAASRGSLPRHLARNAARRLARAAPEHHRRGVRRVLVHAVGPRYGAIVLAPPGPYPGMPVRGPTRIAMAPPPYGMPLPYWRAPYPLR